MSLQDTIVSAWYMPCDVCGTKSKMFLTTKETMSNIIAAGWINKVYYTDKNLSKEDWYCPCCKDKAIDLPQEEKSEHGIFLSPTKEVADAKLDKPEEKLKDKVHLPIISESVKDK